MSDDRPLRHEDYLAMAEENRRLKRQIDSMTKKEKPRGQSRIEIFSRSIGPDIWFRSIATIVLLLVIPFSYLIARSAESSAREGHYEKIHVPPARQVTTCYFVEQASGPRPRAEIWDPWHVYVSKCGTWCLNRVLRVNVKGEMLSFESRDGAWAFIQKWKLTQCK